MTAEPDAGRGGAVRRLSVGALTRVEGQGAIRVRLVGGRIEFAEFNIYEPPRFFEKLLVGREIREVPDLVARICGICPVSYQITACRAVETALGIEATPAIESLRRLLCCGEWIQSHALHVHLLHAPDFLGCESGLTMPPEHAPFLERGLRMKAIGSRLIEVLGGRAVHPVNVTIGGLYRAPRVAEVQGLVPDLDWGVAAAESLVGDVSRFAFPDFRQPHEYVAVRDDADYPMNRGRIVARNAAGRCTLDIPAADYPRHFRERQVPHSTALHSLIEPDGRPYLCGPLARLATSRELLPPRASRAAEACGIGWPSGNPFHAIVARAIELVAAFEEAARIARGYRTELSPPRIEVEPRAGEGCHATEAPRGLLYHRYRIGDDGLIQAATIVPPTSQNQARIEEDLKHYLPTVLGRDDAEATRSCEHLIRTYDPCISCATHFLRLRIDRPAGGAARLEFRRPSVSDTPRTPRAS